MANIVVISYSTSSTVHTNTVALLQGFGHTVSSIAESSAVAADLSGYDLLVVFSHTLSTSDLRALQAKGKPILTDPANAVGVYAYSNGGHRWRLWSSQGFDANGKKFLRVESSHPITEPWSIGYWAETDSTTKYLFYSTGSTVGQLVHAAQLANLSWAPVGYAIEAGTPDLDAQEIPVRMYMAGWLWNYNAIQNTLTEYGTQVITQVLNWLLGLDSPPTAPVISATLTAPQDATVVLDTPSTGADDTDLYWADSAAHLADGGPALGATLLSGSWDGSPVLDAGIPFLTTRYYRAYAVNSHGVVPSNIASVTTEQDTSPQHIHTQFRVRNGDESFVWTSPILGPVLSFTPPIGTLPPCSQLWVQARHANQVAWSEWGPETEFATLCETGLPFGEPDINRGPTRFELWSAPECAGGVRLQVLEPFDAANEGAELDNSERLTLRLPKYVADGIGIRQVIRRESEYGTAEFLAGDGLRDTISVEDDSAVAVSCNPLLYWLADIPIRARVGTGRWEYNLGAVYRTASEIIEEFILPALEAEGIDWIRLAIIDDDTRFSLAWDRWNALELLNAIAAKIGREVEFQRWSNEFYAIRLRRERGSFAEEILLHPKRNLLRLQRTRRDAALYTVFSPYGMVPSGDHEAATLSEAAWEVIEKSGNHVRIADPQGGDDPIAFPDQLNGMYAQKIVGSLALVVASGTSQWVTLSNASGINVGDHLTFRADADGTPLSELSNPAAVAEYGRITDVRTYDPEMRGERNYLPNMDAHLWTGTLPDGYSVPAGAGTVAYRRDISEPLSDLTGNVDGGHSSSWTLALKNLPVGEIIQPGDVIVGLLQGARPFVTEAATVDGSGEVTVSVSYRVITAGDGDPITIERANVGRDGGPFGIILPVQPETSGFQPQHTRPLQFPGVGVLHHDGMPPVWAHVRYTLVSKMPMGQTFGFAKDSAYRTASMSIVDADTGAVLASGWEIDLTGENALTPGTTRSMLLRVPLSLDQTRRLAIRFSAPRVQAGVSFPVGGHVALFAVVHWAMLTVGHDPQVPPLIGSHANRIWHLANRTAKRHSVEPVSYEGTVNDLVRMGVPEEWVTLGARIRLRVPTHGIDERVRIVAMEWDWKDTGNTKVTLAQIPPRLTRTILRSPRLFVASDFMDTSFDASPLEVRSTYRIATAAMPVAVAGALRLDDDGLTRQDGTGVPTLTPGDS